MPPALFPLPTLFPRTDSVPYLIVAPQYTGMSAGVRVMHMLCHCLNMVGQRAYITTFPQLAVDTHQGAYTCPDLCTPLMTQEILSAFEAQGRSPIVVYLEALRHNPLHATHIARYVLNYPGLLGGDAVFPANELVYAYSRRIGQTLGLPEARVMFMPISDPELFTPPPPGSKREGSCFYAAKYHYFHKGPLLPITAHSTEITRYQPDSPTKAQINELFRRSEIFYTYEDTALAIEAALCGCPTVFIPNAFLKEPLGFDDLGMDGFAFGADDADITRAKATVHRFRENYEEVCDRYWQKLAGFIQETQYAALTSPPVTTSIRLPAQQRFHTLLYAVEYIRQYGLSRFLHKTLLFFRKWGIKNVALNMLKNSLRR